MFETAGSSATGRAERLRALIADAHRQTGAARRGPMNAGSWHATPDASEPSHADSTECTLLSHALPGYTELRVAHRGGQSVVYRAMQRGTQQEVAIKVLRGGPLAGPAERARFEREARILGSLRHPDIVPIHEYGQALGHVYLVTDYIHGRPIANCGRSDRELAELIARICDAVQAAHLRGVIHRDLKPANILVDVDGAPRILDFGLAKLADGDADGLLDATQVGEFVGSLPWCSPEQAAGADLDIRTDVYSLGVLLYQLLTGDFPYPVRGRARDVLESVRNCPPRPPRSVRADLDDELETIVLKCLQKEPARRYQSAGELARDLRRYLAGEAIEAKRDSGWYMLRKSLLRHRVPVGLASLFVLMLAVFGVVMAAARMQAIREADKARQVLAFLQTMLTGVDAENMEKGALTVREVLDHAAGRMEREFGDHPEVAASIHHTLGNHYRTLGFYDDAHRHLQKAVELLTALQRSDDLALADALHDLALTLHEGLAVAEAQSPMRAALAIQRRVFGAESLQVAEAEHDLAAILIHDGYERAHALAAPSIDQDPAPLIDAGRARAAELLARDSLAIRQRLAGVQQGGIAASSGMLGWALMALNRLDEAEIALRDAVEVTCRLPGDQKRVLAARLTYLSDLLREKGDLVEEEKAVREAIDIRSRRLAADHPALAWNLFCLAQIRRRVGDLAEAQAVCRQALDICVSKCDPLHANIADAQQVLAQILTADGCHAEAEAYWSACLEIRRVPLPPGHPDLAFAEDGLAQSRAVQHAHRDSRQ